MTEPQSSTEGNAEIEPRHPATPNSAFSYAPSPYNNPPAFQGQVHFLEFREHYGRVTVLSNMLRQAYCLCR